MKNSFTRSTAIIVLLLLLTLYVKAQFPYNESFMKSVAPNTVVAGAAKLTGANGDPDGNGYLRLTDATNFKVGYAYCTQKFPSNFGFSIDFEFYIYKPGAVVSPNNQADGICFYMFDASVNSFRPGGVGGSFGYAQYNSTPGLSKGYFGLAIDEWGNFSNATEGRIGGPGQRAGSLTIRGPEYVGATFDGYKYQASQLVDASHPAYFRGFTQRYASSTDPNYRKIKIVMVPKTALPHSATNMGYKVYVYLYKGGSPVTESTLISNYDFNFKAPDQLQFGFSGSTGASTDFHEIRNMNITVANPSELTAPTLANDMVSICKGPKALIDVLANDNSTNAGGYMMKSTIDLDPATAGIQTSYTDAGKGTYVVDQSGIVTYTPVSGFTGTSTINYTASDIYGAAAATNATITVVVDSRLGPELTISKNPDGVCAPSLVDITSSAFRTVTTPVVGENVNYLYYPSIKDAYNNTNPISATAASQIAQAGTYYIRSELDNACIDVKPIVVSISQKPTTADAGADLCVTNTSNLSNSLIAKSTDVGSGVWSQTSGPATAEIVSAFTSTTPVNLPNTSGIYKFQWKTTNGICPESIDEVVWNVVTVPSISGTKSLCPNTTTTLTGATISGMTGSWAWVGTPTATLSSTTNPVITVSGMQPNNSYTLKWTVNQVYDQLSCSNSSYNTVIKTNAAADAGVDQTLCNVTNCTLGSTNTTSASITGAWSIVSALPVSLAPSSIVNTADPLSTVNNLVPGNIYTLRWTLTDKSNSLNCITTDDVIIKDVYPATSNAGINKTLGTNITQLTLDGSDPGPGNTGVWESVSTPAASSVIINQPSSKTSTVSITNAKAGDYLFKWTVNSCSITSSQVKMSLVSTLPVQFISISAFKEASTVQILWSVTQEVNVKNYELERSENGSSFVKIGTVVFKTPSGNINQYGFIDKLPLGNNIYYRIKQVDLDGKYTYSNSVLVNSSDVNKSLSVSPNPTKGQSAILLTTKNKQATVFYIVDMLGRVVVSKKVELQKGINSYSTSWFSALPSGSYLLMTDIDGVRQQARFINQ